MNMYTRHEFSYLDKFLAIFLEICFPYFNNKRVIRESRKNPVLLSL